MDTRDQAPLSPRTTIAIGAIAAAGGLYLVLAGLDLVPPPGRANGPPWLVACCGLIFLFGGAAIAVPAAVTGQTAQDGELPADAPHWLRLMQYGLGLAMGACLASIGTWVAFGAGTRSFNISLPFFGMSGGGELIGRIAFGFGSVITWICVVAIAVVGWRRLAARRKA